MKLMRGVLSVAAAMLLMGGVSNADEMTDMRQALDGMKREMADMKAKLAEEQDLKASAGETAPTELTTMNGYKMTIGGEVMTEYRFEHGATDVKQSTKKTNRAGFGLNDADLWFDVKTSDVTNLHVKLDLDDTATNGALVEEAYYDWKKLLDGNLGLRVGKHEIAYGKPDATVGDSDATVHGNGGRRPASDGNYMINGTGIHAIGEIDNTLGLNLNYKIRDIARVDFTTFSNRFAEGSENKLTGDNGLNSFATQFTVTPVEKLAIYLGFVNLYNDMGDNFDYADAVNTTQDFGGRFGYYVGRDAMINNKHLTDYAQEMSFGATYDLTDKISLFGQYMHTWNAGYVNNATVNSMNFGVNYAMTDKLTLGAMFDIERVNPVGYEIAMLADTDAPAQTYNAAIDEENYYRAMFSAIYTFDNGIYVGLEYAHEWYDAEYANQETVSNSSKGANQADRFVLWTGITF